jgi:ABC-type Zn uptake system ZnuABC Zn-binding protein ZnuA
MAILMALSLVASLAGGCSPDAEPGHEGEHEHERGEGEALALPKLNAVELDGAPLQVVATTSIIGDVVAQVGGSAIELTTLMGPGQDPHSYQPTPQDMAAVAEAHAIFVNGWDLEEALAHDLEGIAQDAAIVPISAGIEPLALGAHQREDRETGGSHEESEEHAHAGADPHVWFSIQNVNQWAENVEHVLSDLDPAHAATFERNATAYQAELEGLEAYVKGQMAGIPAERRFLVTNHDSLGYLARDHGLTVLGTVLPAASTVAEPSASDLAALIEEMEKRGICTLFAETTVSSKLAETVAAELDACEEVAILKLYTGAVGPAGSGAESYIDMYRHNVDTIVKGLK